MRQGGSLAQARSVDGNHLHSTVFITQMKIQTLPWYTYRAAAVCLCVQS